MKTSGKQDDASASSLIDAKIKDLGGWRAETLARVRSLIKQADPDVVEEVKWRKPSNPKGVPVWEHSGIICTGETYKDKIKLTFAKGAALKDPAGVFNASLDAGTRRAIDMHEDHKLNEKAFRALIKSAAELNTASKKSKTPKSSKPAKAPKPGKTAALLSGGNPRIAKADGDAPVQAYIAAMPGWKRDIGERLDKLVEAALPNVTKAIKWNSPMYGVEGKGWFLSTHCLTKYVKLTFFNGAHLKPLPPGGTPRSGESRWIDIYETDELDEKQLTQWIRQAAKLPGFLAPKAPPN